LTDPLGKPCRTAFHVGPSTSKNEVILFIFMHLHKLDRPHCLSGNPRPYPHE